MAKKVISFTLDPSSIDKAIREVQQYKSEIVRKTELLRERVATLIAWKATQGFSSAIVTDLINGEMRNGSVDVQVDDRGGISVIIAVGDDAAFIEFGAGVYHNGSVGSSPHPKGAELGMTIGSYGKGHGAKNVWGFYEDGELRLTHGTPAAMPMYNAMKEVCADIANIAKEVFSS